MGEMMDRCHVAIEATKLHVLRIRRAIEASRAQIVSTTALIEDSNKRLAACDSRQTSQSPAMR